jgi:quinone-modifying oxidoreductase subunit QmoC
VAAIVGVRRYWRAIDAASPARPPGAPRTTIPRSLWTVLKSIAIHDQFTPCTTRQTRAVSHLCLVFGFVALTVVTCWVITGPINPLLQGGFVYPFNFWSPWKLLANVGGLAMLGGAVLMIYERFEHRDETGWSTYFDWSFLWTVFIVVLTGFATEVLHYLRMVPHRHVVYFVHLVFVFALLIYLPYSKFAHLLYRTTAMVHAEYTGRRGTGAKGGDPETGSRTPPEPARGARS